jgi:phosphatidylinositol-3-phosphatase
MKKSWGLLGASFVSLCGIGLAVGCGTADGAGAGAPEAQDSVASESQALTTSVIQHVFVIAMENHDASQVYGSSSAPYINNTLLPTYAHSTNFNDELALSIPSEPHYLWMEAGTNAFSDHTFTGDSDPSSSNSTSDTNHLATQIKNATNGVTWRTYQEGLNSTTGACPIQSSGFYGAKHDPFVFFKDVAGNPPSKTNSYCTAHHKAYSAFAADLAANDVASYTFITPNLCNDMHGASGCPDSNTVRSGDTWLSTELPRLISYANAHAGVIFITWDEGSSTLKMPFIAVGPGVKTGYTGTVSYTHSSVIKSVDAILQLPTLSRVSSANDLSDLFKSGQYP